MSTIATKKLSKEKLRRLLDRVGSEPEKSNAQIETTEYNWYEPRYFSSDQLVELETFVKSIGTAMAEKFSGFCQTRYDVTVASITQHFADELYRQTLDNKSGDYYLAFGTDQKYTSGFMGIPEPTAVMWTRQLLGDSGTEKESDKDLSSLEESLLLDLTSALVGAFSMLDKSVSFHPAKSMVRGRWPFMLHKTDELCKISFNIKKANAEDHSEAYLIIISEELNPMVGKTTKNIQKYTTEEISDAVLNHLNGMSVTIMTQLATTKLTFEEIMNLHVDDVLLLDKKANQPIDLIIDGRTICYGWPVKSAGKYAVTIAPTALGEAT